jgi:hypothetical protein
VNGDDSHENFEFLPAGIPKGNSTRRGLSLRESSQTAEVADGIRRSS